MSLAQVVVTRRVTVIVLTLGLMVTGIIAFTQLPQELFPPISFPQVTIVTEYVNAAPEEIETLITKPIEEAVSSVTGFKRLESVSREGRSTVKVFFSWGQDIDFAALAVREKIDLVKEKLPKEADDPIVLKYDPLSRPILILSITGQNLEPVQLKLLAEKMIKDNLEKVEGVASATLSGGVTREILVDIDQGSLDSHHLSLLDVIDSIEHANISYPAGSIKKGLYEYLIRTVGEFQSVNDIRHAVAGVDNVEKIKRENVSYLEKESAGPRQTVDTLREEVSKNLLEKRLVLIKDVADVADSTAEKTSVSRYNGHENISISIQKQANANTIQVVDHIRKALDYFHDDLISRGIRYEIIYDHSAFIRKSLDDLKNDAISGGILAFFVLLIALQAFGPALLVTLSIPMTVIGTFFLMSLGGITLNTMSLSGLALGTGMIVDTSIVVLENIFRRRQMGESAQEAAIKGTQEVTWPIITSNATTIAVFLPLIIFVPGILGQLFRDLSWAIIHSQIISTIIPLTIIPLLSLHLKVEVKDYKPWHWTGFLERNLLEGPIKKRVGFASFVLITTFAVASSAFLILPGLEREILPKVDQAQFLIRMDLPLGTRLEVTDRVSNKIEEVLRKTPDVEKISVTIGSEKGSRGQIKLDTLRPSQAVILVSLNKKKKHPSSEIVQFIREQLDELNVEGAQLEFILQENEFAFAEGGTKPILIEVKGYDFMVMNELVQKIRRQMDKIPGVINIQDDMGKTAPETKLIIDKKRAALYGISALDISLIARAALGGVVPTQYREAGREYDVLVRLKETDRENVDNLGNLLLYSHVLDTLIPLKEVATVEKGAGPSEIKRVDQDRTIIVSAEVDRRTKTKDVLPKVQRMLKDLNIDQDSGLHVALSGRAREMKESFAKVTFAFTLALMLVYMIMAAQFESFSQPFIIMMTVPLAFFGVLIALLVSGHSINVISALGVIILVGTVVNNGIVLIEYINQLREEGRDIEEAAIEATRIRTRPILMSMLTSVMGLVPLALGWGEGSELRAPMAVTMMGGLISSTFLTLVLLPCFYIVVMRTLESLLGEPMEEESEPVKE